MSATARTTVSRDAIDKRAELIRSRLSGVTPDFTTALSMLGMAVLQLRELGSTDSSIREAVEMWLAQEKKAPAHVPLWKPNPAHLKRVISDWIRNR